MEHTNKTTPRSTEVVVELGPAITTTNVTVTANHATSSATIINSANASINTAAITSTTNTMTRTRRTKCEDELKGLLFVICLLLLMLYLSLFEQGKTSHYNFQPEVQVDSISVLSATNISSPQATTAFNMVFSFRNAGLHANYSLLFATMYLHDDHKYLSDKRIPSFVLKPNEEIQAKAEFRLIDSLLASDLASGEVKVEVELMAVVLVKLPSESELLYLESFFCSDLKFANSSSKVGGNWMLSGTKTCKDVSW
uniref:Late embryogenesis abundant protein LEA-2 subgroup domain-containing protein n=1 Tax=Fagus sylvatica TaxID=28930 RepID=A0A2N9HPN7_FAGSY